MSNNYLFQACMGLPRHPRVPSGISAEWTKDATDRPQYYTILGVNPGVSLDEIKMAYRMQLKKWHPDKNPENKKEAEEKSKLITEAYKMLSDENKRKLACSLNNKQKKTGVLPAQEESKMNTIEKEPKLDKVSFQGADSAWESNSSCSDYDDSTFDSIDESEDNLSLESKESSIESNSESTSKTNELTSESSELTSDSESNNSNLSRSLSSYTSDSAKPSPNPKTMQNISSAGKTNFQGREYSRIRNEIRQTSVQSESHTKKRKFSQKSFIWNGKKGTWRRKARGRKSSLSGEKSKQNEKSENQTGNSKFPKLEIEQCGGEGKKDPVRKKEHSKKNLLKGKNEGLLGKCEMPTKKSPTRKNRPSSKHELDCGARLRVRLKESLEKPDLGQGKYPRKKTIPLSQTKGGLGRKTEAPKTELKVVKARGSQRKEIQPRRSKEKNMGNVQKNYLHPVRNNTDIKKREGSKTNVRQKEWPDGKVKKAAASQTKEKTTEDSIPYYTWKVPATVWLGPAENANSFLYGGTSELLGGQTGLSGKQRPYGTNQPLQGNPGANIQVWNRMNQFHLKKNMLPHIDSPFQNKKTWPPSINGPAEVFYSDASLSCPRCSQCWCKLFCHRM